MLIQKGAAVWYTATGTEVSVEAVIDRVADKGTGRAFAVSGVKLDLKVGGKAIRSVPFVGIRPTDAELKSGFCGARAYVPPPKPLTFDQAVAQVKLGKTAARPGKVLTPEDLSASDWTAT
jgi:hypothetical protein